MENLREQSEHGSVLMHNAFDVAVINALWTMFAGRRFEYNDEKSKEILETIHNSFRCKPRLLLLFFFCTIEGKKKP